MEPVADRRFAPLAITRVPNDRGHLGILPQAVVYIWRFANERGQVAVTGSTKK